MTVRKAFTENWPLKITAFILAVSIWFYVTSKGKTEVSLTVPLTLRNIPAGMAVVGNVPGTIEVRLQGQERILRDISTVRRVVAAVDLSRGKVGDNPIRLSPDDIRKPSGTQATYLAPYELTVRLDPLLTKTVRVHAALQGAPATGFRATTVTIVPGKVAIEGPASILRSLPGLQTLPIDIAGKRKTFTTEARIDYQGKPVTVQEQKVNVTVVIQKEQK